jgi:hypothetical protein
MEAQVFTFASPPFVPVAIGFFLVWVPATSSGESSVAGMRLRLGSSWRSRPLRSDCTRQPGRAFAV